jgi:uncharacterized protein involved in exopolysaccharide biosynthesis
VNATKETVMGGFKRYWWLVILITVIFAAAGAAYGMSLPKSYRAQASVLVDSMNPNRPEPSDQMTSSEISTQAQIVLSEPVLLRAMHDLDINSSKLSAFRDSITAQGVGDSRVIRVTATRSDPKDAVAVANNVAQQYLDYREETSIERIRAIGKDTKLVGFLKSGTVISPAVRGVSDAASSPLVLGVLAGLLGLLLSSILAVALGRRPVKQKAQAPQQLPAAEREVALR